MYISCRALSNMLRMLSKMALDFSACDNPSNAMQGFMHCLQAQAVSCQLVSVNQFERTTRYPAFIKPLSLQLIAAFELRNKVTVVPMVSQTVGLRSSGCTPPRPAIYRLPLNNKAGHVVSPESSCRIVCLLYL